MAVGERTSVRGGVIARGSGTDARQTHASFLDARAGTARRRAFFGARGVDRKDRGIGSVGKKTSPQIEKCPAAAILTLLASRRFT
jgi:hypothetical protein